MDSKKIEDNKIFYHLNTLGIEFKKDTIGKTVSNNIEVCCKYFCVHFCKYNVYCHSVDDKQLPWCPIEELK